MATKKSFDFKLGDKLKIARSGEIGVVAGRAHYVDSNPTYWVRYTRADGVAADSWFNESELDLVEANAEEPAAA